MEASAFATYEALKAVATWLDTLLTLLGNPLPPVRPEHLFSGPVYLKALELLAAKPLSELASEQGFTSKLDGTLAEDYFRAVLAVCTETRPVAKKAKWHGTLMETGCKRVLGVHLVKSGKNRTDVGRQPGASGGKQGMVGPTRPGFFSSRWWKKYCTAVVRLKMAKKQVKRAKIKMTLRRTTMTNLEERKLRVCFYKARLLDDEERLSGVDFEKNPEKRAAYLRELKEFGDESIIPSRRGGKGFTADGVKVKSTRCRK